MMNPDGSDDNLSQTSIASLESDIIRLIQTIDRLAESLTSFSYSVFGQISHIAPQSRDWELGYIKWVSWLYIHYFEVGRSGISYLLQLADSYFPDLAPDMRMHWERLSILRTVLFHNLSYSESQDINKLTICQNWFRQNCNTAVPTTINDWRACQHALLSESRMFLSQLIEVIREIELDPNRDYVLTMWQSQRTGIVTTAQLDQAIREASISLGYPTIDPPKLRKRYEASWKRWLSIHEDNADLTAEIRKLVEDAIIGDLSAPLPVSTDEIIEALALSPGPQIRKVLERARSLYDLDPCSREDLLTRLRLDFT